MTNNTCSLCIAILIGSRLVCIHKESEVRDLHEHATQTRSNVFRSSEKRTSLRVTQTNIVDSANLVQRSATAEGGPVIMAIENSSMTFKATITVGVSEQVGYWDANLVKHCRWFTLKKTRDSSLRRK